MSLMLLPSERGRTRTPTPLALRLLVVPVVVAVVLAGLWVSGGLITNDFALAMWLSVGWMGLAGLIALAIAARSRAYRWPVLGAYLLTAAVTGVYLGSSVFLDSEVNERVALAGQAGNVEAATGAFEAVRHEARGTATVLESRGGRRVLTLTGFEVDNGPDLRVYLVAGPADSEGTVEDFVDLGALKGNRGNQQYALPAGVDIRRHSTVVVWCRAFSVLFARAPLA